MHGDRLETWSEQVTWALIRGVLALAPATSKSSVQKPNPKPLNLAILSSLGTLSRLQGQEGIGGFVTHFREFRHTPSVVVCLRPGSFLQTRLVQAGNTIGPEESLSRIDLRTRTYTMNVWKPGR